MATEVINPVKDELDDEPGTEPVGGTAPDPNTAWIEALQADTPAEEIHKRTLAGKELSYVTARYVQDRLDAAVGPANWRNEFESLDSGAVRCGIGILVPAAHSDPFGPTWVTKWDVGVPSSIEPDKGAHSDAFKRAGVQWGIARDLYEERDEDQPAPQAATGPVRARVLTPVPQGAATGGQTTQFSEDGQVPGEVEWVCPIHDDVKVIPAGISKRTGRSYKAFYACPVAGCDQKGNSVGGR